MSQNDNLLGQCNNDYESYSEYRAFLVDGEQKVSEGLDKAVLAISSAALALTFSLFKTFHIEGNDESLIFIQSSWLFFGLSMACVLVSLLLSGHLYYLNRKEIDVILENRSEIIASIQNKNDTHPRVKVFNENNLLASIVRVAHYCGAVTLLIGVLLFGVFVNENLGVRSVSANDTSRTTANISRPEPRSGENSSTTTATSSAKSASAKGLVDKNGKEASTTATPSSN